MPAERWRRGAFVRAIYGRDRGEGGLRKVHRAKANHRNEEARRRLNFQWQISPRMNATPSLPQSPSFDPRRGLTLTTSHPLIYRAGEGEGLRMRFDEPVFAARGCNGLTKNEGKNRPAMVRRRHDKGEIHSSLPLRNARRAHPHIRYRCRRLYGLPRRVE